MNQTRRLRTILVATVLAATPAAAQTSPANPFGLSQGSTAEPAGPHPHHEWRTERARRMERAWRMERARRMGWRRERMEGHGRWTTRGGRRLRGRAWARRGARWERRGLRSESREFSLHRGRERWRHERAFHQGQRRRGRRWEGERSRADGDSLQGDHPRGDTQPSRHRADASESDGSL